MRTTKNMPHLRNGCFLGPPRDVPAHQQPIERNDRHGDTAGATRPAPCCRSIARLSATASPPSAVTVLRVGTQVASSLHRCQGLQLPRPTRLPIIVFRSVQDRKASAGRGSRGVKGRVLVSKTNAVVCVSCSLCRNTATLACRL